MTGQKPSIGRIVIFERDGFPPRPAIILSVSEHDVDLTVFYHGCCNTELCIPFADDKPFDPARWRWPDRV